MSGGMFINFDETNKIMLIPLLGSITLSDQWTPGLDGLHNNTHPWRGKVLELSAGLSALLGCTLASGILVVEPIATMRYTNTTEFVFTALQNTTGDALATADTGIPSNSTQFSPPWGDSVDDFALLWHHVMTLSLGTFFMFLISTSSPAILRLMWINSRGRLVACIGTTVLYSIAATFVVPNIHDVLWQFYRTMLICLFLNLDALMAGTRLRFARARFME